MGCLGACASGEDVGEQEGPHCLGVHEGGKTERGLGKGKVNHRVK